MEIKTLAHLSLHQVYEAFCRGFGDYSIPMQMEYSRFVQMMQRNAAEFNISVGLFDGEHLVGFIINGARNSVAYDSGTAILPEYRGHSHAKTLLDKSIKLLKQNHFSTYQLEVLQDNEKAIRLYRSRGFKINRNLICYGLDCENLKDSSENMSLKRINPEDVEGFIRFLKFFKSEDFCVPSFQNSDQAVLDGNLDVYAIQHENNGCGFILGSSGSIAQIFINSEQRKKGFGTAALRLFSQQYDAKSLRIINVDEASISLNAFFKSLGAEVFATQHEMLLSLV